MPSLRGMKGDGYYDQNSTLQNATFQAVAGWIDRATAAMPLPEPPAAITLVDYGCSEGRNSIIAMNRAVAGLRLRRPDQAICAVHSDLPSNNFNQLFANLHNPAEQNYLLDRGKLRPNTFSLAAAGSFYQPVMPPRSVHMAMSFLAIEWLERRPDVAVPDFIGGYRGSPAARAAFDAQADRDLTRFLELRAEELAPGAPLLIIIPGRDGARVCVDGFYDVVNDACLDLVAAGRLPRERFERFVFPVHFRSLDQLRAPVDRPGSPVAGRYSVALAQTFDVPTPFEEAFKADGDREAYAAAYTGAIRATSEPVIAAELIGPDGGPALVAELYDRVRARLAAEPERYTFRNIEVAVLLIRSS
jgi:gibberellin A4 carboxyl methyltransferase